MRKDMAAFIIMSVMLAGCAKKNGLQDLPPPPADTTGSGYEGSSATPSSTPVPGSQADFVTSVASDRIFFDTDKFDVDAEDQAILQSQARWLLRFPQKQVVVEGHCDERGTREYNIALGERRANSAKNYLAALGIDPSRMTVISYGKEKPAAVGSDEASWAQNRRAVTLTVD